MDDKKMFGERLRAQRIKAGWTGRDLAKALEIHPSSITRFEHGENWPSLPTVLAIMRLLHCSADDLLDWASESRHGQ